MAGERRTCLVRIHPAESGERASVRPFEGARMTLGRDEGASVRVDVPGVSRLHARIERPRGGGALRVQDLGSRNGTFVDGLRVSGNKSADWAPGTVLRVGEALFVHRVWDEEEARVAALPPLPGPLNSRYPPLVLDLRRVQRLRADAGAFWVAGEDGSGRSVLVEHLRALVGEGAARAGGGWIDGAEAEFRIAPELPAGAVARRSVRMPPLRERPEDVLPIVAALCGGALPPMLPRLVEALHLYPWPGNVRELRVLLERAAHTRWGAMPGSRWDLDHFPDLRQWGEARERPAEQDGAAEEVTEPGVRKDPMSLDARGLRRVLDSQRWRLFAAARALGLDRVALLRRMAELGIRGPGAKDEPAPAMIEHETTGPHPR